MMNNFHRSLRTWVFFSLYLAKVLTLPAQTFSTLVNFNGNNGASPIYGPLIQATDGNLYGSTELGGINGLGTLFEITPLGTLTTLYSFNGANGSVPSALVQAADGNFYGATWEGGDRKSPHPHGLGTIFTVTPGGSLTTLYRFKGWAESHPYAGLVDAGNGEFYGTCYGGGGRSNGTIFKVTARGKLTTLHSFVGNDGANPNAGLVLAADGNFYGTTAMGGANGSYGTIFKITAAGVLTTLHSFDGSDGTFPIGGLVEASNGEFYGTTAEGGADASCNPDAPHPFPLRRARGVGCGTIFKITPQGALTTLHSFHRTDGSYPTAAPIQATDLDFYGTTSLGGDKDSGTIFKISSEGRLTVLHSFDGADGYGADSVLLQSTDGNFYGTTAEDGAGGDGTIFKLAVGLGPFVKTVPIFGKVGAQVVILGQNLTGATGVMFNGTPATFTVNAMGAAIATTVPAGAVTGKIEVVVPSGTLSSNVDFRIRP